MAALTNRNVSYTLDKAGNRTNVNDTGVNATYTPNTLNQYGAAGPDAITNGSEHEIASYQGVNYTYINDGRLTSVTGPGGTYTLKYDALGRTVSRTFNGVTTYYYYDGERPIQETDANGSGIATNVYGIGVDEIVIRFEISGAQYFFYQDHEGSVTHVRNQNQQLVEQYRYDAFGAPTIMDRYGTILGASAIKNRFMFTGREYNQTFGFYEYRARAYHPGIGRFMSEDPKGFDAGDFNLFRYCNNDPEDRTDPMGMSDEQQNHPDNHVAFPPGAAERIEQMEMAQQTSRTGEMAAHTVESRVAMEIVKTGDRNIHKPDIITSDGRRLNGLTDANLIIHDPVQQSDGSSKITAEMNVNVYYADSAGPKTRAETARLEPQHAAAFDKWFEKTAVPRVNAMNQQHFDSPAAAQKTLESQLRRSFIETRTETHRMDFPRPFGTGEHVLPYKYEE